MSKRWIPHIAIVLLIVGVIIWAMMASGEPPDLSSEDDDILNFRKEQREAARGVGQWMLASVLITVYLGFLFVKHGLPWIADTVSNLVFADSRAEVEVEDDLMREGRSLLAQGEYEGALVTYLAASKKIPSERMPICEAAKVAKVHLEDPKRALEILEDGLAEREWEVDDEAFFLFRISELYVEDFMDKEAALQTLNRVKERFPESRHAANATHQIKALEIELG